MSNQPTQLSLQQEDHDEKKNQGTRKVVWGLLIALTVIWLLLGLWQFSLQTDSDIVAGFSSIWDDIESSC